MTRVCAFFFMVKRGYTRKSMFNYKSYVMKRVIFLWMAILFGAIINVSAQTLKYYSTDFCYKVKDEHGYWTKWTEWKPSNCLISVSLDRRVINIYSKTIQEFDIYDEMGESEDDSGHSYTLCCIDKDGLRCRIKFRLQDNGILQIYVEYNDAIYVYCIEERN